ncbi:hypothetical protein JAAARDRAFT_708773 [Jaapia argillacea MUCL 33604]|uniref:PIG-P domain-containing protein n=1 Tax=Jaapia argillacea MUCL 33604 TaxID=933084 RepID=A0A067QDU3_9AGAM|nr:hypothetical protein JAAARDRAFT_708773 [Jaapia argillacea MUCL 33604]
MVDLDAGHVLIVLTLLFFLVASYAVFFSAFLPLTGFYILDAIALDTHYKYFTVFLIPTTSYFVIANWVGWQYFRNS